MVATLLSLRFRVLWNSLRRSVWQLIGAIFGALYGLGLLVGVVAGLIALLFAPVELATTIIVLAGSALVLGWVVIPLVLTGVDQTLEPARLAQFPMPLPKLLLGLTLAGVLGVPGIVTSIAALATTATWLRTPASAVAAPICAVIAILTCVIASRVVTAVAASLSSHRRFRELSGILIFIPLILLGPLILGVTQGIQNSADALPGIARMLGYTPLGAAWSVPADLAAGSIATALVKLLIALVSLALLVVVWRRSLAAALITPPRTSEKRVARGKIGLLGRLPATPAGAITARALTYWRRDPRYARSLIVVPLIPVLLAFYSRSSDSLALLAISAPIVAFLLSLSIYTDISYDGTAFATHIAAGVRGRDDRLGRVAALAIISVPLVLLVLFVTVALADAWSALPALIGLSFGALAAGLGVSSVASARILIPVPAPGDNPFKSTPGAGFTTGLWVFVGWGILLALMIPTIALAVLQLVLDAPFLGWLALPVGLVTGAVCLVLGLGMGGRELDRSAPVLLSRLKKLQGA